MQITFQNCLIELMAVRRQWLDNITRWSEMGLVDIVRLAEDRNWYRRFLFGAAYARLPGTANFHGDN